MTTPCTPPPGTKDGTWPVPGPDRSAHWLERFGERTVFMWDGQFWPTSDVAATSKEMQAAGWRYLAPVPTPEEVEALRRTVAELHKCESINPIIGAIMEDNGLVGPTYDLTDLGRRALGVEATE